MSGIKITILGDSDLYFRSIGGMAGSFGAQESKVVDDEDPSKLKDSYLESGTQGVELDDKDRPNIDSMYSASYQDTCNSLGWR